MTKEQVILKVNEILVEEFEIDKLLLKSGENSIASLDIDSLDLVDLVVLIEENFGFKVINEEMSDVKTLNDFYKYVLARAK